MSCASPFEAAFRFAVVSQTRARLELANLSLCPACNITAYNEARELPCEQAALIAAEPRVAEQLSAGRTLGMFSQAPPACSSAPTLNARCHPQAEGSRASGSGYERAVLRGTKPC